MRQESACPMDAILRLLMGPWTTYILWILRGQGPLRFGELKQRIPGISAKMLTQRLRALEAGGLIWRDYAPSVPPRVTYGLARRGRELEPILDGLNEIALKWAAESHQAGAPEGGTGAAGSQAA